MKKILSLLMVLILVSGCAIDPYTGEKKIANTGWGAGIGAALGGLSGLLIGGSGTTAMIGAAAGGALGGGIGYAKDHQENQLRARLEGTGVRIQRQGKNLNLIMPGNITFASNSFDITPNFLPVLDSVAIVLNEFNDSYIDITGFTDSTGSANSNQLLSEKRANSVASYLVQAKVNHGRIQARGFGERYPIAPNDSAMSRAQNRRIEISIRPQEK